MSSPGARPVPAPDGAPPGGPPLVAVPGQWPSQFAQALAEALAGARPSRQLTSWTTQRARSRIRQLGPLLQAGPRPRVRRVLSCAPSGDVVELAVILSVGPAVRAMAVRLERAGQSRGGQPRSGQHRAGLTRASPGPAGLSRDGHGTRHALDRTWLCTDIEAA